ncbi:uncharacterized protein DUF3999 [Orbus hercynius]|uniref:Uncharacterized protein DUF3999 n=1 Tax=Orbus hercynius TaxID=593135 RepID=A0A495RC40_9GAMM|nr:DUF3999 family protein [Orbus hercynius]RKS85042.1 uncharacterized protein DUF3999 [Orbus hercynius]
MIIKSFSTLWLLFMVSFSALSAPTESTDNYAFGAELTLTDTESMFSRVELNKQVYLQSVSPTLDDIRVFNRNGQAVPFTLINVYNKQPNKQQFNMDIYPINQDNLANGTSTNNRNYTVAVDGQTININIDKPSNTQERYTATYLLHIPDDNKITQPISNLALSFAQQAENWQATASILYSPDLRYWGNVVNNESIMVLSNQDKQQLALTDINFQPNSDLKTYNWLITLNSAKPIPQLTQVIATSSNTAMNNALFPIDASVSRFTAQNVIYTLPVAIPVKELSIELYNNRSILPVSIFYKTDLQDEQWIKFDDRIIRKTNSYDEPTRFSLNGRLIGALKLDAINSSFEQAPKLVAYRNKVDLVFNSANNAPFILAWGSAQSKAAALPSSTLLSATDSLQSLPLAFIGSSVKLAGDKVLIQDSNSTSANFPRWIIWLGLIGGAFILVLLALRLLKEIKK